jgi:purine-nucleoside phosphorylase
MPPTAAAPPSLDIIAIEAAEALRHHAKLPANWQPVASVVLGSGLGQVANSLLEGSLPCFPSVNSALLPGLAPSLVPGHHGRFIAGYIGDVPVLFQQGRIHGYEGHHFQTLTASIRLCAALGSQSLILTNAAGGIHPEFQPGDLMLIRDHLKISAIFPAFHAVPADHFDAKPPSPSPWCPQLQRIATSIPCPLRLHSGVYAMMPGPAYETPAEVRMLRTLGADAVGMSTVPEALEAAARQMPTLGISCITNIAAGLQNSPLSHAEVTATGSRIQHQLATWLSSLIPRVASDLPRS